MSKPTAGFTIIELLVASTLSISAAVFALRLVTVFGRNYANAKTAMMAEADMAVLERDLAQFFERTQMLAVTSRGAPAAGFLISGDGAFLMRGDLRNFVTFDPRTSNNPGNFSDIRLLCCDRNMLIRANLPPGGSANVRSRCVATGGLSVEVIRGGQVERSQCFSTVTEMNVATAGVDERTSNAMYWFDLVMPAMDAPGGMVVGNNINRHVQLMLSPSYTGVEQRILVRNPPRMNF